MKNIKIKILQSIVWLSIISILIFTIWYIVLNFMNPDMTEMRLILTYPTPFIGAMVSALIYLISAVMYNKENAKEDHKLWTDFMKSMNQDMNNNLKK